jgi:putative nucleotidyltransferase with HDIG domain
MWNRKNRSRDLSSRPNGAVLAAAIAVALPAAAVATLSHRSFGELYRLHFVAVSATTAVAVLAAFVLTSFGARRDDRRAVVVGTAFSAMGALLLLHGLATPDVLMPEEHNGLIAFAGGATLPIGAVVLCLVGSPKLRAPGAVRRLLWLQAALISAILLVGVIGLTVPSLVPAEPSANSPPALLLLAVSLILFGVLASRARRTFVLTRRPADLCVLVGVAWLTTATLAALLTRPWTLSWWIGHLLETLGMLAVGLPVSLDLRRGAQSRPLAGDLTAAELVAEEESLLGPQVRALMLRLADKDTSTEEHTRRVALLAVRVGEALELSPARLRRLAIGGLLHDIGKLQVPDAVLKKPDRLTDDEFEVIRCHPQWGDDLARTLGFSTPVRQLIRSHHERLDGNGYPGRLEAAQINLDTRILTVCDVYDALVSRRVYRDAFGHARAMQIITDEEGAAFDPACVRTLRAVLAADATTDLTLTPPDGPPAGGLAAEAPAQRSRS